MSKQICVLDDGRRVVFSLKKRARDSCYQVSFRGPDGRRKERSTKEETNQKRAFDAAVALIRDDYSPKRFKPTITWDEALERLEVKMRAGNRRPTTIDDYKINVENLRRAFPRTKGPAEITPEMAEDYKEIRLKKGRAIDTIRGNLVTLRSIYGKWWIKTCKVLLANPFADIDKPKSDRRPPRIVSAEEHQAFLDWLSKECDDWRLPIVFLEVKWLVGCRISELAAAPTVGLEGGRIRFEADTTKGRKQRKAKLPQLLFEELTALAGTSFVFERFSEQLRRFHFKRGNPHHARCVGPYRPDRLKVWLERQAADYFKKHPQVQRFKLHNFRGTAMSRARSKGVSYDDASVAFGCHPETMRKHYVSLDEEAISDKVMDRIQDSSDSKSGEKSGEISPPPSSQPQSGDAA